jgi:hypothetical protein
MIHGKRLLYEIAKGWLTGTDPKIGEMHKVQKEVGVGD